MKPLILSKYLRLQSFDVSTESGRADERYRLALMAMCANVLSRGAAITVMIFAIKLTTTYLGVERFGVWMTIASLIGMLSFLDFGVGNSLANTVSRVSAKGTQRDLMHCISGGVGVLIVMALAVSFLLAFMSYVLPWQKILKISEISIVTEVEQATVVFSLLFGVSILANGVQRIFSGLQRAFEAHLVGLVGSLLSLAALFYGTRNQVGISLLLILTFGVQTIASLFLLLVLAKRNLFAARFIAHNFCHEARGLFRVGGLFFILQVGTMVGWGSDGFIIGSYQGVSQVAVFSTLQRLFMFASQPVSIFNSPLWGAYADAHARGDSEFVKRTFKKSLLFSGVFAISVGSVLFFLGEGLVSYWTNGALAAPTDLLAVFLLWTICDSMGNALAMLLNGCGIVREQVVTVMLLTFIAFPVKLYFIAHKGVFEMMFSYVIVYCLVVFIMYGLVFRKKIIKEIRL